MKQNQKGYALLAMTVVLAAVAAVFLIQGMGATFNSNTRDEQRRSLRAMKDAKVALIVRAISEDNTPGTFICPDSGGLGTAKTSCSTTTKQLLGCLPWQTLGLESPAQQGIQPLWYALSPIFNSSYATTNRAGSDAKQINLDNAGALTLVNTDNNTSQTVIAAILSPGFELENQRASRTSPNSCDVNSVVNNKPLAQQFFEAISDSQDNAANSGTLVVAATNQDFNDLILPIARNDLYKPLLPIILQPFAANSTGAYGLRWYLNALPDPQTISTDPNKMAFFARLDYLQKDQIPNFDTMFDPTASLSVIPATKANPNSNQCEVNNSTGNSSSTTNNRTAVTWLCANNWYKYINYLTYEDDSKKATVTLLDPTSRNGYGCRLDTNRTQQVNEQIHCSSNILGNNP